MKHFTIVQNSIKTTLIFRENYIKKLLKHGSVSVIAPNDDLPSKLKLEKMGVTVYQTPTLDGIIGKIHSIAKMNYYIIKEREKGSTIISHFLLTFLVTYPSLVPFNKKLVVYTEGLGSVFTKRNSFRNILKFMLLRSKAVRLFCNESERELLGLSTDTVTSGIGINLKKFKSLVSEKPNGRYELLYVGRLIKDKGVQDAISVLNILTERGYNVRLNLVGDVYPNNPSSLTIKSIETLKRKFGDSINFVGFSDSVKSWYEKSHILLLPSMREGFPVVVMEASAMGIPTVGYKVDGVKDAISVGLNGLLADYGDIEQLAHHTETLLNLETLKSYEKSSIEYAIDNFDCEPRTDFITNLLVSLSDIDESSNTSSRARNPNVASN